MKNVIYWILPSISFPKKARKLPSLPANVHSGRLYPSRLVSKLMFVAVVTLICMLPREVTVVCAANRR